MELTKEEYLEVLRIVSECKPSRLKYVLAILKEAGIAIDDEDSNKVFRVNSKVFYTKQQEPIDLSIIEGIRRESREKRYSGRWIETSDPIILTLREAYLSGTKISTIAEAAGITRTALYEYMIGRRQYSPWIAERFTDAFKTLNIQYPFSPSDPPELPN